MLRRFPGLPLLTIRTVIFAIIFGLFVRGGISGDNPVLGQSSAAIMFPQRASAAQLANVCAVIYSSGTPKAFPEQCLPAGMDKLSSWAGPVVTGVSSDPDSVRVLSDTQAVATARLIVEDEISKRFIYLDVHIVRKGDDIRVGQDGYSLTTTPEQVQLKPEEVLGEEALDESLAVDPDVQRFLGEVMACYAKSDPCLLDKNPTAKPDDGRGLDGVVEFAGIVTDSSLPAYLQITKGDKHCARIPVLWKGVAAPQLYYVPFAQAENARYYILDKPRGDPKQCLAQVSDNNYLSGGS